MNGLYPKGFWRPHLILLLILTSLKVVNNCFSKLGGHGENCSDALPCQDGFECDDTSHECLCPSRIAFKLKLFYDQDRGQCVSGVGQRCSLESAEDDGLWKIECVPYAKCVRPKGDARLADIFGLCECWPNFEATELVCKPVMGVHGGNQQDPIVTMNQDGGMNEGEKDLLQISATADKDMFQWSRTKDKRNLTPSPTKDSDKNRHLSDRGLPTNIKRIKSKLATRGPVGGSAKDSMSSDYVCTLLFVLTVVMLNI